MSIIEKKSFSKRKVAVLVVHGVNAKVPDTEFSNLEAVTDLLTNHDFTESGINYNPPEYTRVPIEVNSLPKIEQYAAGDSGTEVTKELLKDYEPEHYYHKTRRHETVRRNLDRSMEDQDVKVHLYEIFWADLSRPVAFSGLQAIYAFFELLFNVCSLGRKSLTEASKRNAGKVIFPILAWLQVSIEWILTLGIPLLNGWFFGALLIFYPLTLDPVHWDAIVPPVAGFASIAIFMCFAFPREARSTFRWLSIVAFGFIIGLLVCVFFLFAANMKIDTGGTTGLRWIVSTVLMASILCCALVIPCWFSRHRNAWPFWSAICLSSLLLLGWQIYQAFAGRPNSFLNTNPGTLRATVLRWADLVFAGCTICWVAVGLLNFLFMIGANWALWTSSPERLEKNRRALWTTCISNTIPAILILVLTLGMWQLVSWTLRVDETSASGMSYTQLLPLNALLNHPEAKLGPIEQLTLREAAAGWVLVCRHPWIHYCYLYFIIAATLTMLAVLPQIMEEVAKDRRESNGSESDDRNRRATWLGGATDDLFTLLKFAGELCHRYLALGAPLVIFYTYLFRVDVDRLHLLPHKARAIQICIALLGLVLFLGNQVGLKARTIRLAAGNRRPTWRQAIQQAFSRPLVFSEGPLTSIWSLFWSSIILLSCLLLPVFPFTIHITWALAFSAFLVLVGSIKLFQPILSVALDVVNWLRHHPVRRNPRSRMFARYYAMLRWLKESKENYHGLVIIAHSQGTVLTVELFRYLDYIGFSQFKAWPISLFTMGCPLRQLYNLRFPDVYDWVGRCPEEAAVTLNPTSNIYMWSNAYTTGDYIGRNLWTGGDAIYKPRGSQSIDCRRSEICVGEGGHIRYWDWRTDQIAKSLDRLIAGIAQRSRDACNPDLATFSTGSARR